MAPWLAFGSLALAHCSGGVGDEGTARTLSEAIVGGAAADAPYSPVLFLNGPEGSCSAVLVAPTLALTARHCVASTMPGSFECTAAGDVVNTGDGAGQIGADNAPGALSFFAVWSVNGGAGVSGAPDAVGAQVISSQTPTACRDDLAFVVLDRPIPGIVPAPIRITRPTAVGDLVSVWGYGLTGQLEPTSLRVADGVPIAGIGPDVAPDSTQLAPVRAVRVGPVTCQGDSGGPIVAQDTGAVLAIVSLGSQASANGPYCSADQLVDTTGPRLADYHDWIVSVFQMAGASPITDDQPPDAAADLPDADTFAPASDASASIDDASTPGDDVAVFPDDALVTAADASAMGPVIADGSLSEASLASASASHPGSASEPSPTVMGGSCTITAGPPRGSQRLGVIAIALGWTAAAVGRRRR
jgi:hypothetical protein